MTRTLPAALNTAMNSGIYSPIFRFHTTIEGVSQDSTTKILNFKLQGLEAEATIAASGFSMGDESFQLERGVIVNGVESTIKSSDYFYTEQRYERGLWHIKGHLLPKRKYTAAADTTYADVINDFCATIGKTALIIDNGDWSTYQFYPAGKSIQLNNAQTFESMLRQKYIIFITDNGDNELMFFQPAEIIAGDYTISDPLATVDLYRQQRRFVYRDENSTVHYYPVASLTNAVHHNLGYLESTAITPAINLMEGAHTTSRIRVHLKYQTGDNIEITGVADQTADVLVIADVIEAFDNKADPAWYQIVRQLNVFSNTDGGPLPSTIERVSAYTPLVTTSFDGNLDDTVNNLQALAQAVDDLPVSTAPINAPTATNDFLVGAQVATVWTWVRNTLAQTITVLRTSLDSIYAAASHTHSYIATDGWTAISATGTSGTLDSPSFEISFNADMTAIIGLGDRIKITQSTTKYFIVTKVGAFSAGATIITCYGGTDYTLVASGTTAITNPYYSHAKAPFGFPMDSTKWTVSASDTNRCQKTTPTPSTWYGGSGLSATGPSIVAPIGAWYPGYKALFDEFDDTTDFNVWGTLSTANNSESDTDMTSLVILTAPTGAHKIWNTVFIRRQRPSLYTTKTTLYLNVRTTVAVGSPDNIDIRGDVTPTIIDLVCAYL